MVNARRRRTLLRCFRVVLVVALLQLVIVVLVTLRLKAGGAYPGVVDVSDYVPISIQQSNIMQIIGGRGRNNKGRRYIDTNVFNVPKWQTRGLSVIPANRINNDNRSSGGYSRGTNTDMVPLRHPPGRPLMPVPSMAEQKYFLTQVLHVRIYSGDKARWTIRELKQWMHYMYYAGVEHIFICDHAQREHEKIGRHLENYVKLRLATYIHWPQPRNVVQSKLDCYRYFMKEWEGRNEWQVSVDMDEYPFVAGDLDEGFLARYLRTLEPEVVQVLMENYLMLGDGDRNKTMVIERITRRTRAKANKLTKPLYRPDHTRPGMHRFYERRTTKRHIHTINAPPDVLVMLHYWGARLQRAGQPTREVLDMTEEFPVVSEQIGPRIRNSLIAFGEFDAFSNETGP